METSSLISSLASGVGMAVGGPIGAEAGKIVGESIGSTMKSKDKASSPTMQMSGNVDASSALSASFASQAAMLRGDKGFYGHMTIEKCYQMSGTKGTLRSDKSSFAKSTSNGMHVKKGR